MPRFQCEDAHIDSDAVEKAQETLVPYFETLHRVAREGGYDAPECSINASVDTAVLETVMATKERYVTDALRYVFLIGIGGSSLGAKAVYQAIAPNHGAQLIFVESCDPFELAHIDTHVLSTIVMPEEVLLIVISKSGTTTETMTNATWLLEKLSALFSTDIDRRIVAISDHDSPLSLRAQEKGWGRLVIPRQIGGRFSVFTAAGLFPLACAGVAVDDLLAGARSGRETALHDSGKNPYVERASVRYHWYVNGLEIETLFSFHKRLMGICSWHRQLTAESLGKQIDNGAITLLPDCALGSEDLHSVFQLYFGLTNQSTTFLDVDDVPTVASAGEVLCAIEQGVQQAYRKKEKPFASIHFSDLTPYELGAWMQGAMIETMLLAKLLGVNAFDQPNVEEYKKETRRLLAQ